MNRDIRLTEEQVTEIKDKARSTRKEFGVFGDVPIARDIFMLLENKGIILCQYPFKAEKESHLDANIVWFVTKDEPITFIGLNTSIYYDEQIFALAHELYHFVTKTGKAYRADEDEEDKLTEKMADRFAAELVMRHITLRDLIVIQFKRTDLSSISELRLLRFIARLQDEWWLPYHSLVIRLQEEGYIKDKMFEELFDLDDRDPNGKYGKIFKSIGNENYKILNEITGIISISNNIMEMFIQNYEDGDMTDDDFADILGKFGKTPADFGFEITVAENDLEELSELFEGGGADEG